VTVSTSDRFYNQSFHRQLRQLASSTAVCFAGSFDNQSLRQLAVWPVISTTGIGWLVTRWKTGCETAGKLVVNLLENRLGTCWKPGSKPAGNLLYKKLLKTLAGELENCFKNCLNNWWLCCWLRQLATSGTVGFTGSFDNSWL
jgi:hypothetical protein